MTLAKSQQFQIFNSMAKNMDNHFGTLISQSELLIKGKAEHLAARCQRITQIFSL